jgi:hypothetical protein
VTGLRPLSSPDRFLGTVLFVDVAGSAQLAAEIGDSRFRELIDGFHQLVRRQLDRYQGRLVDTAGDGAGLVRQPGPGDRLRRGRPRRRARSRPAGTRPGACRRDGTRPWRRDPRHRRAYWGAGRRPGRPRRGPGLPDYLRPGRGRPGPPGKPRHPRAQGRARLLEGLRRHQLKTTQHGRRPAGGCLAGKLGAAPRGGRHVPTLPRVPGL